MTPLEHPEELLALADAGRLTPAQRGALREHLAWCDVCAVLVDARGAFAKELEPEPADSERDRIAVQSALARFAGEPARRRRMRRTWLGLAAALPLTGLAAASGWLWSEPGTTIPRPLTTASAPLREPSRNRSTLERRIAEPARAHVPEPLASAPAASSSERSWSPKADSERSASAAELFQRAGELRRRGADAQALAVYRDLQTRFAGSSEAKLSRVIVGRLLLDRNDPAGALAQFRRYLGSGGPAAEEALVGSTTALARLGRRSEERQAWQQLLERFPSSVHAQTARSRLRALEGVNPPRSAP